MNAPWADVGRRWSEAAELLRSAGRAPLDVREWLGSGWTGAAADGFAEWGRTFEQATGRAAAALTDAASAAGTLATDARLSGASPSGGPTSGAGELGAGLLSRLEAGVRAVAAVPVPGAHVAPRRPVKPAPKSRRRRTTPAKRHQHATSVPKRRQQTPPKRQQHAAPVPKQAKQSHAHYDGQVRGWIDQARGILHEHGYRPEQTDPDAIAKIIHHESGGNPTAVNRADSNAARGHPSTGLMQTIQPTFNLHHLPGHDQILNPVDNIIAGVRYAVSRYGSVSNVPGVVSLASGGHYKGY